MVIWGCGSIKFIYGPKKKELKVHSKIAIPYERENEEIFLLLLTRAF